MRLVLRHIRKEDEPGIAEVIRQVMTAYGCAGPGFSIHDPEVDHMYDAYRGVRAGYWVLDRDGQVCGGAGFAPLEGAEPDICELKKMYFLPEVRGSGWGQRAMEQVLSGARQAGYSRIYLETVSRMTEANGLYRKYGFALLEGPWGSTGHHGCDFFYSRHL